MSYVLQRMASCQATGADEGGDPVSQGHQHLTLSHLHCVACNCMCRYHAASSAAAKSLNEEMVRPVSKQACWQQPLMPPYNRHS
jgi:hypothetical protein